MFCTKATGCFYSNYFVKQMLLLRNLPLLCKRTLFNSSLNPNRFTRDSLRNRIQQQNLKDLAKQRFQNNQRGGSYSIPPYHADIIPVRPGSDLLKAAGFTVAVTAIGFGVAVVADVERTRSTVKNFYAETVTRFQTIVNGEQRDDQITWKSLSQGDRTAISLVAMNIAVFLMWKAKGLQPFMWRYFSNSFASRSLCLPMLLSVFSHSSAIHLALNMYVVYSFTNVAIDKFLGPDQFWAFYVVGGVVASLTSLMHKFAVRSSIRALGASGAILALLAYTCMKIPDARLKIVFVPGFDFSAQSAIYGILLFDLAGLVFKFGLFDHAAHLGGTLFGVFYALWGEAVIWEWYGYYVEQAYRSLRYGKEGK